ncbi:OLC1v1005811C1 [Oldenlandia corymbosa var. corymbosa]|uniref:OLC1v1005811C1 n=1 Tax=Oldenlandia corymbosa var. corymbosa TaxID=529605 RepID=A0AAV1DFL0_OLDCO|nr:OLC1v1005811C1 [Oldenlandia corymbosa var. corymbosa]
MAKLVVLYLLLIAAALSQSTTATTATSRKVRMMAEDRRRLEDQCESTGYCGPFAACSNCPPHYACCVLFCNRTWW